jgi:hypothetical protein
LTIRTPPPEPLPLAPICDTTLAPAPASSGRSEITRAYSRSCAVEKALPLTPPALPRLTALTRRGVLPGDVERWETEGGALAGRVFPPPRTRGRVAREQLSSERRRPR